MSKQNKWQMNRAGLVNFWYYDNEIFDFADGKLLLRGSNGSGKSVTMQSILPVLLDGKKSPDRLDPFGSRARKMEDYLLGEKEIVDRDERTGYLFIEYKRKNTNQYITTGMGLQARRYKNLNFWGFVITDNRRIGKDLFLYEQEQHAGEKQQIPLSRVQLENRIGAGGHVVRTQGEYMKLVNKYIFGFETIEAYEDLIKLLIQLRSPKLSRDFRPTVIYEILEAALPPLKDEDLRHLSDTIEHMDQIKQQIEQLEREHTALNKLNNRYHAYNKYRLAETAGHYIEAMNKCVKEEQTLSEKEKTLNTLQQEIKMLTTGKKELEQKSDVLEKKQTRLQQHKVWNLANERAVESNRLQEIRQELARKDKTVTAKTKQELHMKEESDFLIDRISIFESEMADQLIDLEADAEEASFDRHLLNTQDFRRNIDKDFNFTVWKKEAEQHYERIDTIGEQLRTYEQTKQQMADLEKVIANKQLEKDKIHVEVQDWLQVFEHDKQEKMNEINTWIETHHYFPITAQVLQQTARDLHQLYEPTPFERIRMPYVQATNDYQLEINEQIATKNSRISAIQQEMTDLEQLRAEWEAKRDPEPPNQREQTKEARRQLEKSQHRFVPFYEAVEFQEHVSEQVRKRIEAALLDAGLLNALITDGETPVIHDCVIQPNPQMMVHTLADYLKPDVNDEMKIPATRIDDVLRSVLVTGEEGMENSTAISEDGTYQIGLVHGHAVPIETVRFIGRNARKRYREAQILRITEEIDVLKIKEQQVLDEIFKLKEKIQAAQDAMKSFPDDLDLHESFQQMEKGRFRIEQLEKELLSDDEKMGKIILIFQEVKWKLDAETRNINLEFSYDAYQIAKQVIRRYEKELGNLHMQHVTYRHKQKNLVQTKQRQAELIAEIDELKGECNLLKDKEIRLQQNIAEIEKQLQTHGMEDIRRQIEMVQTEIAETKAALAHHQSVLPKQVAKHDVLQEELAEQNKKIRFSKQMVEAWRGTFVQEINYQFVTLPEELGTLEEQAKWVMKQHKEMRKDATKIERQLTDVFFAQQPNLMEYRMTDTITPVPSLPTASEQWADEQLILLENWKETATRRLIQLDFQGKRLSPYYIEKMVEQDRSRQQTMLNTQDRLLYEEILFHSVGKKLRSRIYRAQQWTKKMNELMEQSDSTSGISFSIQWKPRTAETEAELDTKQLVDLLRRDPRLLKEEDLNQVMEHFRSKIDRAKELIELKGEGNTLLQVLKEVLDYRYWFSFVLTYQRIGEPKRELTNNAFYKFSGGEKAMAMYIPLFTACYSRYLEARSDAPFIISLDEAFAGVDDDNISVMFRIVEELGFDYMINSQVLWGDYDTVSSLSVCELVRPKNADYVSVIHYYWNGKVRQLITDGDDFEQFSGLKNVSAP